MLTRILLKVIFFSKEASRNIEKGKKNNFTKTNLEQRFVYFKSVYIHRRIFLMPSYRNVKYKDPCVLNHDK
jgi:hypothetical protein